YASILVFFNGGAVLAIQLPHRQIYIRFTTAILILLPHHQICTCFTHAILILLHFLACPHPASLELQLLRFLISFRVSLSPTRRCGQGKRFLAILASIDRGFWPPETDEFS